MFIIKESAPFRMESAHRYFRIGAPLILEWTHQSTGICNIYGTGNMLDEFFDILIEEDLMNYIHYRGVTNNIKLTISQYDAVVDFSLNHSFGMPYIEGILNGKMVFCMRNEGSLEVLIQIPYAYINSFDDLTYKLLHLPDMTVEELRNYYNIIYNKYSRYAVADKFISILE